jgi:hypothetical protein
MDMSSLTPLCSSTDISTRLGRALSPAETTRVPALIGDATSQIVRHCRKDFQWHPNDVLQIPGDGSTIKLPYRPVVSVSSVVAISGRADIPNIPVTWWVFDGVDEISIAESTASGVINLPEAWYDFGAFPGTYQVTYSHGYQTVPDEVVMVAANAVIGVLLAPTMAAGVIGETVGAYSYRMERSGGGLAVALNAGDLAILDDYRDKTGSQKLRAT